MSRPVVEPPDSVEAVPRLRRFAGDAGGATSIEYAMIAGMIFLVVVASMRLYATKVSNVYQTIGDAVSQN